MEVGGFDIWLPSGELYQFVTTQGRTVARVGPVESDGRKAVLLDTREPDGFFGSSIIQMALGPREAMDIGLSLIESALLSDDKGVLTNGAQGNGNVSSSENPDQGQAKGPGHH